MSAEREPSRSCLLIAMPQLADPNFYHTVSVLVSFDQNGAFALILNRTLELTVDQVLGEQIKLPEGAPPFAVHFGGPVQVNSLWFVHAYEAYATQSIRIVEGLFMTTDLKAVQLILDEHALDESPRMKFILGYSGWAPGQLEQEIASSSWITGPIETQEFFETQPPFLWDSSLSRLGIPDPSHLVAPASSGAAN